MSPYIQLERGNDWGTEYLARPGERLNATGTCADGLKFTPGSRLRIKWPADGHEETVTIDTMKATNSVSGHGHIYTTEWQDPGFFVDNHGHKGFVPLDRVLVHEDDLP